MELKNQGRDTYALTISILIDNRIFVAEIIQYFCKSIHHYLHNQRQRIFLRAI